MVSRTLGNHGKQVTENEETVGFYRDFYTFLRGEYPYVFDTSIGGYDICSGITSYCRRDILHFLHTLIILYGGVNMKIIVLKAPKILVPFIKLITGMGKK